MNRDDNSDDIDSNDDMISNLESIDGLGSNYKEIGKREFDDAEKEVLQIKITKDFQENVIRYVKLDDLIREKQDEIKELKQQAEPCKEFIIKYLDQIKTNAIEVTNGRIIKNKSESKTPLNKDIIKEALKGKIQDAKKIEEIINLMDELRPVKERVNLKRTFSRK